MAAVQPGALASGPDVTNKQTRDLTFFFHLGVNVSTAVTGNIFRMTNIKNMYVSLAVCNKHYDLYL
jgi:hypothetical protein